MTLLWSLISGAGEWLSEAPFWVWLCFGAFAVGFGLGAWGLPWGEEEPSRVTMHAAEQVDPSEIQASVFASVLRHAMPEETDTVQTVLPAWVFQDQGSENEIDNVTYDVDLPSNARLPRVEYMTVPMIGNTRPAVNVGPDRVRITLGHPDTGRPYTYRYAVPEEHWSINTEGTITSGFNLDDRSLTTIGSTVTGGLSYSDDPWSVRVAGGLATSVSKTRLQMLGVGELSIQYTVASW